MATGRVPTTANSPLTAKGDLFTYDTSQARLAVGNNGETLVADSSATTGLRWQGTFAAGKNKLINGDFNINQRNFSSTTTSNTFGHDRWTGAWSGGTVTYSNQSFTPGTAPVAGYEAKQYARLVTSGQSAAGDLALFYQPVESVRTFAGQTVTYSFWAKASSGTPKIALEVEQFFGLGGSPSANVDTYMGQVTLSTSWQRYSLTFTVPSISGKTLGTTMDGSVYVLMWTSAGTNFNARTGSLGIQNATIDIWGCQWEAGSVATAFQTATGTLAGELAACQRYYEKSYNQADAPGTASVFGTGIIAGTNALAGSTAGVVFGAGQAPFKVTKRATPTMNIYDYDGTINAFRIYPADAKKTGLTSVTLLGESGGLYFTVNNTSATAVGVNSAVMFNWTASAEL